MSYIHLAIPIFFALIAVELLAARLLERETYRLADSVADLSCGILQQVLEVFLKTALFAGYAWLFTRHRLIDVSVAGAWAWAACFVGVDLLRRIGRALRLGRGRGGGDGRRRRVCRRAVAGGFPAHGP